MSCSLGTGQPAWAWRHRHYDRRRRQARQRPSSAKTYGWLRAHLCLCSFLQKNGRHAPHRNGFSRPLSRAAACPHVMPHAGSRSSATAHIMSLRIVASSHVALIHAVCRAFSLLQHLYIASFVLTWLFMAAAGMFLSCDISAAMRKAMLHGTFALMALCGGDILT